MKKLFTLVFTISAFWAAAQCTTTNATSCQCPDGSQDCDLIPNIKIAYDLLMEPNNNPETPGMLRVSVATSSLGFGPLTVLGSNYFVCGPDTLYQVGGLQTCPDGTIPRQLLQQKIYHKSGNTMTNYLRWAGSMTYHPNHGHSHFDNWGVYELRIPTADPNPLNWPIVGTGAKLGFCLMDYGTCTYYNGYCRDANNNIITNNIANYGLGGGGYNCNPTQQGISVGYADIYYQNLDGMYITLPPGTCNGDYAVVVQIDPARNLLESDYTDNVMWAPITLTEQTGPQNVTISLAGPANTCDPNNTTLSVPQVAASYLWSNGETTPSINPEQSGTYTCTLQTVCGDVTTPPVNVTVNPVSTPVADDQTICRGYSASLTATGNGTINWYDAPTGGNLVYSGNPFNTPILYANTDYYVDNTIVNVGGVTNVGQVTPSFTQNQGNGNGNAGYEIFDVYQACTLNAVTVYANSAGSRTIVLRQNGNTLQSTTVSLPAGQSVVNLNFALTPGVAYQLGIANNAFPDLQRSTQNVSYPYQIPGVLSINDSRNGANYFYYFYDWQVQLPDETCTSSREKVHVTVRRPGRFPEYCNPVGHPTRNNDPRNPGLGMEAAPGVGGEAPAEGALDMFTPGNIVTAFDVIPNPNDGVFSIQFFVEGKHNAECRMSDITGKRIFTKVLGECTDNTAVNFDFSQLAAGMYTLQIVTDGETVSRKVIIE